MKTAKCRTVALLLTIVLAVCAVFPAAAVSELPRQPYPDSRFFDYGDYQIHYRVQESKGESRGFILMLHGFLCSTYAWRNMAPALCEAGYTCVLADLPDFGYSTRETAAIEPIPRETLMRALMEFVAPGETWIIAGHSMGGGVAINIAEQTHLRALLLYCPCPQASFPAIARKLCEKRFVQDLSDVFFRYGTRLTPLVRLTIWAATNDLAFARDYNVRGVTDPVQSGDFGAGLCGMMRYVLPTDMEHTDQIDCPVLLVQGEKDVILPASVKRQVNEAFPQAETAVIPGGGHQCIENRAEEIAALTVDFLSA